MMKTDLEIQKNVQEQLRWEPILNAAEIGVAVKDGVVTLTGQVDSYVKKMAVEKAAKRVGGVKAVAEEIQVGLSAAGKRTDAEIAAAVVHALKWDTSVPDDKLQTEVENGFVTLTGQVDWAYQRTAAQQAIEKLTGVKFVFNNITLKTRPVLADIKEKIKAALVRDATIDADKISITLLDNKVVLSGTVRSLTEKEDAELAAWAAPGVSRVQNSIQVDQEEFAFE
jgi:osmotically-inducible protein OsmY